MASVSSATGGTWRAMAVPFGRWSQCPLQTGQDLSATPGRLTGMAETTERVLHLLGLLQQRPVWTGPELAERLGRHHPQHPS